MSMPPNGTYYIVNKQPTSNGTYLALTFNGSGTALTVIEMGTQPGAQKWILSDAGDGITQVIRLKENTNIRPDPGSSNSLVAGTGGSSWAIRGGDGVYTIAHGNFTNYWGISGATVGQPVVRGGTTTKKDWMFVLV